jgi:hypothetical protein
MLTTKAEAGCLPVCRAGVMGRREVVIRVACRYGQAPRGDRIAIGYPYSIGGVGHTHSIVGGGRLAPVVSSSS